MNNHVKDDALLTKVAYRKAVNGVIVAAVLTMVLMIAFPIGDMGWIRWDFIAWSRAYPLKVPFLVTVALFMVMGKYAFNMPFTMHSTTWELPDVLLERPRLLRHAIKLMTQTLTLLTGLLGIYLGLLLLFSAIFNLIHSQG